jgi:hypothetical protein
MIVGPGSVAAAAGNSQAGTILGDDRLQWQCSMITPAWHQGPGHESRSQPGDSDVRLGLGVTSRLAETRRALSPAVRASSQNGPGQAALGLSATIIAVLEAAGPGPDRHAGGPWDYLGPGPGQRLGG